MDFNTKSEQPQVTGITTQTSSLLGRSLVRPKPFWEIKKKKKAPTLGGIKITEHHVI